ncbi:Telomerase Cajal body protein 1 [Entomortierella beljakovae]|nr:Telomerase Cajal body protein 1 [Entomortierella beljakovae]
MDIDETTPQTQKEVEEANTDIAVSSSDNTHDESEQGLDPSNDTQSWESQTFQLFEQQFSKEIADCGIIPSFTTKNTFNSTVGEARLAMGITDDQHKMTNGKENNFFKSLKWSPDGSCLLSSSNDNSLRIFALPDATSVHLDDTQLTTGVLIKEGETIYDMCWYPAMNSQDPATCCILSSSRDHPVHLWDAYTGNLRCSYTMVDHCEVNVAPKALCFNLDGSKIYCGSNNMIEIFDTTRPGKDSFKRPTVPTRKSKKGQKGVISCLSFNPDQSDLYAAGSYLKTIGLYDSRAQELLMLLRDNGKQSKKLQNQKPLSPSFQPMGGVTQVQFSPDGTYLYSASRQDSVIRCWDIRNTASVLYKLKRPGEMTNQRISFDISSDGRWLYTGDMNGDVSIFDLIDEESGDNDIEVKPFTSIHCHDDVVSATALHPSGSILATSSGQRKYELSFDSTDSDSEHSEPEDVDEGHDTVMENTGPLNQPNNSILSGTKEYDIPIIDNSIRLWSLPGQYVWYVNGQRWTEPDSTEAGKPSSESIDQESIAEPVPEVATASI